MRGRRKPLLPEGIRRAFRLALRRPGIEADIDDEVAFHIEMRTGELIARGMAPDAAREEARRRFGDIQHWSSAMTTVDRERTTRRRRAEWLGDLGRDLRYTSRALRRQPLFTAGVVATLALGIGANATMFGIVDQLLLRPPAHVLEPSEIRRLYATRTTNTGGELTEGIFGYAAFAELRETSQSFANLAAWTRPWPRPLGRGVAAREVFEASVSASFFPTLGVRPHRGRFFTEEEDRPPAGSPVAVLGYAAWQTAYGGDDGAIGRTVTIGGDDYVIVGVAPQGFSGVGLQPVDVWLPITRTSSASIGRMTGSEPWWESQGVEWLEIIGRLAPGITAEEAEAELAVLYPRFLQSGVAPPGAERGRPVPARISLGPIQAERGPQRSGSTRVTIWLLGVSAFVLIIACANVTNLLLARAARQRREIAMRLALGAGRVRLMRQLLLESLLLATVGGVAGLLVAHWGGGFVRGVLLPSVAMDDVLTDPRVLGFTLIVVLLMGALAGLAPAMQASRPDLTTALKAGAREGGGRRARTRTVLLMVQSALSVVLLVGAGLFVRSLANATEVSLGFEPERVLRLEMNLRDAGYTREETRALYEHLLARMRSHPAVESAAFTTAFPFSSVLTTVLRAPGRDSVPAMPGGRPLYNAVSPDYFATIGTPLLRGREFTSADRQGSDQVAIVSETTARTLWPGEDALGRCVRLAPADTVPCHTVVGVVADVRWEELQEQPRLHVYVSIAQKSETPRLLIRPRGDISTASEAIRRAVYEVAPRLMFARLVPISTSVDVQLRPWQLGARMFTAFGVLALIIAAVGLYSMVAYTVTLRAHELGVRVALGASRGDVLQLVVGDGVRVTAVGVVMGMIAAVLLSPRLESLLYGVGGRDPIVLGGVALALLAVALLASLVPAIRAARADPVAALRND